MFPTQGGNKSFRWGLAAGTHDPKPGGVPCQLQCLREPGGGEDEGELALQAQIFANRETTLSQELASLRQSEKETKKLLFNKSKEALQPEAKILNLRNKVIDLVEKAEGAHDKMAKLEERATQQEIQLGRVEGELAQNTELFKRLRQSLSTMAPMCME